MSNFYNQASWVLVPSGIEEDIVFAQKPTSGLGDLSFTRASDATYTDSTGVVRRSPYNLLQFSEQIDNAYWVKTASTITANVAPAPFVGNNADKWAGDGTTTQHILRHSYFPATALSTVVYSFYVKADGITKLGYREDAQTGRNGAFNIETKSVIFVTAGDSITFEDAPNGYVRVILQTVVGSGGALGLQLFLLDASYTAGNPNSYASNVSSTQGVLFYAGQIVNGTSALDYFPTTNRQDVPRIDFRNADGTLSSCGRLLLEPQRTNSIRNSSMVGAVAGTPGTLPTNYTSNFRGFSSQVVGTGTENGVPYIDLRLFGTSTGGQVELTLEGNQQMAALSGQTWSLSSYLRIVAGSLPSGSQAGFAITERNSAGASLVEQAYPLTVTSSLQRFTTTRTLNQATTAFVNVRVIVTSSLTPADFTIRIAAPQMELGAYATTWVPTTTAAVTRIADTASKTGVSSLIGQTEGTIFWEGRITQGIATDLLIIGNITNSVFFNISSANQLKVGIRANGILVASPISSAFIATNIKIAFAYKSGDIVAYVNGVQLITNSTSFTFSASLNEIEIGRPFFDAKATQSAAQAALFPTRLTNAQLAQLTTL